MLHCAGQRESDARQVEEINESLVTVLVIAALAVCGVAVWVGFESIRTLRATREFIGRLDERLMPLVEKADVAVDALGAELLRVDGIVSQIEEVSDRVSAATSGVHEVLNAPATVVNVAATRLRSAVLRARRSRPHGEANTGTKDVTEDTWQTG